MEYLAPFEHPPTSIAWWEGFWTEKLIFFWSNAVNDENPPFGHKELVPRFTLENQKG